VKCYASYAVFIVASQRHILAILGMSSQPQIAYAVVCFVAVDMVYFVRRPNAVNVEPRQTMRSIDFAVGAYLYVPRVSQCAGISARPLKTPLAVDAPCE